MSASQTKSGNRNTILFQCVQGKLNISLSDVKGSALMVVLVCSSKDLGDECFLSRAELCQFSKQHINGDISILRRLQTFSIPKWKHVMVHAATFQYWIVQTNRYTGTENGFDGGTIGGHNNR